MSVTTQTPPAELVEKIREKERELEALRSGLAAWEGAYERTAKRDGNFTTISGAAVEPLYTPLSAVNEVALRLRDDVVSETDQRALNQRSAPAVEDGLFLVPKVIE